MGFVPLDPSYKARVLDFEQNLDRKILKFRDRILRPRIGSDQGVELEPHGVEVEAEAAVGQHHDGVIIAEVMVVVGAKSAPVAGMPESFEPA